MENKKNKSKVEDMEQPVYNQEITYTVNLSNGYVVTKPSEFKGIDNSEIYYS